MSTGRDFWTRRREAVVAEEAAEIAARRRDEETEDRIRLDAMTDAELLAELDLPEPESLAAGDDFSAFMTRAVPDRLRRRALRALWRTNPVLANVDGLVDYGADFTDRATVVEKLQTAYTVGRGMLAHLERLEMAECEETVDPRPDISDRASDTGERPPLAMDTVDPEIEEESTVSSVPRRMVFTYRSDAG